MPRVPDCAVVTGWRVMTWNLLGSHDPDLGEIAAVIREHDPDVVALQEVRRGQARRLARRMGWQHVWTRKHYPYSPLVWWRAEGLAIVAPWALSARLGTTITPEASTWTYRHRVLLAATVTRRDGALRVFDTHLSGEDADRRIAQARRVADRIRADTATTCVLAGDFNTIPDENGQPSETEVLREFGSVGLVDHGGEHTNPSNQPYQRIDYVLLPTSARWLQTLTPEGDDIWRRLSDHLPVLVEFEV